MQLLASKEELSSVGLIIYIIELIYDPVNWCFKFWLLVFYEQRVDIHNIYIATNN